jgi:hypothetical protein
VGDRGWRWAFGVFLIVGCTHSGPELVDVRGTVSYQGKPVATGTISFLPMADQPKSLRPAVGSLSTDGAYELRAFPGMVGVIPGEYQVSVTAYTGSLMDGTAKYLIPKRFTNPQTSGLKATVPAGGPQPLILDFSLVD